MLMPVDLVVFMWKQQGPVSWIPFCVSASSTRWLAESKPLMLMSEAREHSWIFKFKGKREICNAKGLEGNCLGLVDRASYNWWSFLLLSPAAKFLCNFFCGHGSIRIFFISHLLTGLLVPVSCHQIRGNVHTDTLDSYQLLDHIVPGICSD